MTLSDLADIPRSAWPVLAAIFGLVFGSFVTALSYRAPRGENFINGRSKCPVCGTLLTARDLIPVFSWVLSGGRCRHCGAAVSWRYPAIEIAVGLLFGIIVWRVNDVVALCLLLPAAVVMAALTVIDLEHRRLPLPMLAVLALLCGVWGWREYGADFSYNFLAAASLTAIGLALGSATRFLWGQPLIGAGDIYSLAIGGLAFSWLPFLIFLGLAGVVGVVLGVAWRLARAGRMFPFAPAVFLAFWVVALCHDFLVGLVS